MRGIDGRRLRSRVKGRAAITQSLRRIIIRTHRFGTLRAVTPADRAWAGRTLAALQALLDDKAPEVPPEGVTGKDGPLCR